MIYLYTGTPGGGKSLDMVRKIYSQLRWADTFIVSNFDIRVDHLCKKVRRAYHDRYCYLPNDELTPAALAEITAEVKRTRGLSRLPEGLITLYIDECHLNFDSREWQKNTRIGWPQFFSTHRHNGYNVVLCTQRDSRIDKQIRGLVEVEVKHRALKYCGAYGQLLTLGGLFPAFLSIAVHYDTDLILWKETFFYHRKFGKMYDSYGAFLLPSYCTDAKPKSSPGRAGSGAS